jgi:hypothetical protein
MMSENAAGGGGDGSPRLVVVDTEPQTKEAVVIARDIIASAYRSISNIIECKAFRLNTTAVSMALSGVSGLLAAIHQSAQKVLNKQHTNQIWNDDAAQFIDERESAGDDVIDLLKKKNSPSASETEHGDHYVDEILMKTWDKDTDTLRWHGGGGGKGGEFLLFFIPQEIFLEIYGMLYRCIKHRPKQTIFAIPLYLENVRQLFISLVKSYSYSATYQYQGGGGGGSEEGGLGLVCAEDVSRLFEELSEHAKTLNKYVPYLLTDYIRVTDQYPLPPAIKQALLPGVYALISMCTEHELQFVFRVLEETGKATFRKLYEDYQHNWKFTGKV